MHHFVSLFCCIGLLFCSHTDLIATTAAVPLFGLDCVVRQGSRGLCLALGFGAK